MAQIKDILKIDYNPVTVILNSGIEMEGFLDIKENSDIKFKDSLDSNQTIIFKKENIKSLIFEDAIFQYMTVVKNSSKEIKALQVEIDGDVMLFSDSFKRYMPGGHAVTGTSANVSGNEVQYYLGKKDQTEVTFLGYSNSYSKKFKKIAEEYFGSCSKLLEKISNREFERFDITGIVNFYNNECNKI